MVEEEFDALLTFDKNLQYQQNFRKYTIPVFALSAIINTCAELSKLTPLINDHLGDTLIPGQIIIKMVSE
ncbi:MAG: hypothetical protein JST32_07305 [Bacteroidetes bacterium]|nr:hypothetical protein [Bacteroidota bacterium]